MQALDQDARKYEIANLPDSSVAMLDSMNTRAGLYNKVATCGDLLKAADFKVIEPQQELRNRVTAPDEYIALRRALGIYPLTSLFVSHGVSKWHREARNSFSIEPPLVLSAPDLDPSNNFVTVAMESSTHYVQHLYPLSRELQPAGVAYSLADYGQLRSLPYSSTARRSMLDQYSLAPGTERLERFILWPTGVLSPGGMRQWGRHPVVFVGRRHFDDPFYMDRMFVETDSK